MQRSKHASTVCQRRHIRCDLDPGVKKKATVYDVRAFLSRLAPRPLHGHGGLGNPPALMGQKTHPPRVRDPIQGTRKL